MIGWNGFAWVPGNPELPECLPQADKRVNDLLVKYNTLGRDLAEAHTALATVQGREHGARDADIEAQADALLNNKKAPGPDNYRAWCVEIEEAKSNVLAIERARDKVFGQLKSSVISDRDQWKNRIKTDLDEHVAKMRALLDELEQVWMSAALLAATDEFLDQNGDYFHISPGLLNGEPAQAAIAILKHDVLSQFGDT